MVTDDLIEGKYHQMYKMARGHAWMLLFLLCLFSGVVSAFIVSAYLAVLSIVNCSFLCPQDNVTTILLLTPVSIR